MNKLRIFFCPAKWCECNVHLDWYYLSDCSRNNRVTCFIHSLRLQDSKIDVVIPRYMMLHDFYGIHSRKSELVSLYYLCLSKLLTVHCGCIQTQLMIERQDDD